MNSKFKEEGGDKVDLDRHIDTSDAENGKEKGRMKNETLRHQQTS